MTTSHVTARSGQREEVQPPTPLLLAPISSAAQMRASQKPLQALVGHGKLPLATSSRGAERSCTLPREQKRSKRKGTGEVNPPTLETPLIPHQKPLSQGPVPLVPPVSSRRVFPGSSRKCCGRVCLGRTCLVLNKHRWGCWGGEGGSGEARSPGLAGRVLLFHTLTWPATRGNFPSINFLFITYLSFKS